MRNRKGMILIIVLAAGWIFGQNGGRPVQAGDAPGDIIFKNTRSFAPVTFSHSAHKQAGLECKACHNELFKRKKGSTDVDNALNMKVLRKGKYCGACHNGKQAFSVRRGCKKCHKK